MTRPVIGISTYEEAATWRGWHRQVSLVPTDFVAGVAEAGATPVLLPPFAGRAEAERVLLGIDGVLLVGGADIAPELYGSPRDARTGPPAPARDEWEAALIRVALDRDLPILGVCRGMQMLNVVRGGTLRQHLPSVVGTDDHQPDAPRFATNVVRLTPENLPGSVLGDRHRAACYHHQAIDTLGDGLIATGWASDGTIEAIVDTEHPFAVGVQWHPEVETDRRLFAALVAATDRRCAVPLAQ